jgi:hypothetical protein
MSAPAELLADLVQELVEIAVYLDDPCELNWSGLLDLGEDGPGAAGGELEGAREDSARQQGASGLYDVPEAFPNLAAGATPPGPVRTPG